MKKNVAFLFVAVASLALSSLVTSCRDRVDTPTGPDSTANPAEQIVFDRTVNGNTHVASLNAHGHEVAFASSPSFLCDVAMDGTMLWSVGQNNVFDTLMGGGDQPTAFVLTHLNDSSHMPPGYVTLGAAWSVGVMSQPSPVISPDGKLIAYSVQTGAMPNAGIQHIHIQDAGGGNDREVYAGAEYYSEMRFSPNSDKLVFVSGPPSVYVSHPESALDTLAVLDIATNTVTNLTTLSVGSNLYAARTVAWSSQNVIAYRDGASVRTINADGTDSRFIDAGAPCSWSPDGSTLAYFNQISGGPQVDLMLTSDFGVTKRNITNSADYDELDAHWSSDGMKILSTAYPHTHGFDWALREIDVATGTSRLLGTQGAGFGRFVKK